MNENGLSCTPITPLWPQANSKAENFNKELQKTIRTAQIEGFDWKRELDQCLLKCRSTPNLTTRHSPAKLLFNRDIRRKSPSTVNQNKASLDA